MEILKCLRFSLFCLFGTVAIVSCQNIGKSESEVKTDKICNTFEEGTRRAQNATSSKELYDLTYEIRDRIRQVGASETDVMFMSEQDKVHAERVMKEFYNAVETQNYELTGHSAKWTK